MKISLFIARRYLFARKKKSVINIISWISLVGLGVSAMAMVVVLSVYNGIGGLTQKLFSTFDPELLVTPATGKTFHTSAFDLGTLRQQPGVRTVSLIVEENAWVTYRQNQAIIQLRGVDGDYPQITGIDTLIYDGEYVLNGTMPVAPGLLDSDLDELPPPMPVHYAVLGALIFDQLGLRTTANDPIAVHIPKRGAGIGYTLDDAFNNGYLYFGGTFYIQQDIDGKYVLADIDFVRDLMDYEADECTSMAVALQPGANVAKVKRQIREALGPQFEVRDRMEQQPMYYKIFKSERFGIILILSLIVLISTLNLIASLSLLIIDKRKDIGTMRSIGMERRTIRRTFFAEGVLISAVGVVAGELLGFVVCFLQHQFGLIRMGQNFVVSAFPVEMHGADFLFTFVLVMVLSTLAVWFTTRRAKI